MKSTTPQKEKEKLELNSLLIKALTPGRELIDQVDEDESIQIVSELLDQGADANARAFDDSTVLMLAAENGHTETVAELLERGADVNEARKSDGITALIFAAQNGHTEIVAELLDRGADIEARASNDGTALMFAAQNSHTETVSELLARGADIYAIASDGYTALMRAAKNGHTEIVLTLLPPDRIAREIDANAALMFAAGYGHIETVDELLDQGADVNAKTSDGRYTALTIAAGDGHTEIVFKLLNRGADLNAKTSDGYTALMRAAKNGHTEIVLDLLSRDNLDWEIALDQFGHLLALPNLNKEVSFLLAVIIHDEKLRNSIITKFNQENTDNPINQENNDILGVGPEAYKTLKDLESWYKGYLTDPDSGLSLSEHKAENLANQRFFKLFNDQGFRREVLARNDLVKDLLSESASLPTDFAGLKGGQNYLDAARRLEPEDLYKLTSKIIDNSKAANGGTTTSQALSLVEALRKDRTDQASTSPATAVNLGSALSIAEPIVTPQQNGGHCVVS